MSVKLDINSLLAKETLTGDEVGKIFLLDDLSLFYKNKNIVTNQERQILCTKIKSKEESEYFECYKTFNNWLHRDYNAARANSYQAWHLLSEFTNKLQQTIYAEQIIANKNSNNQLDSVIKSLSVFEDYAINFTRKHYASLSKNALKTCLCRVLAFNCAIELFSDFFDIIELQNVFTVKIEHFEYSLINFNKSVKELKSIATGTKETRVIKKKIINQLFPKFNIADLEPNESSILEATKALPDLFKQHSPNSIINILKKF